MHGANGHYGHRSILNDYAQVSRGTPLPGLLQHGWNHDMGATVGDVQVPQPDPFFAWNARNLAYCQQAGMGHAVALGAPFLYLPPAEPVTATPRSLFAVPLHSWEREKIPDDFEAYAVALAQVADQFDRVSVSLYWFDYQDERNRAAFERRGLQVVTSGPRDDNPAFLLKQRQMLLEHSHVTSNRVQTGFFYGLSLGLSGFVLGPPAGVEARIDRSGALFDAWQRATFPELLWDGRGERDLRELGLRELGAEFKRSPSELRDLLQWRPEQRLDLERRAWAFRVRTTTGWRSRLWRKWQASQAIRQVERQGGAS